MSADESTAEEIFKTHLNAFAFLATSLCKCTTAGAMIGMCDQQREEKVGRSAHCGEWYDIVAQFATWLQPLTLKVGPDLAKRQCTVT
jgi:hypothetical protein